MPEKIELYQPYHNRECLDCYQGARGFEELEDHAGIRAKLAANETSCLDCHDLVHELERLPELEMWNGDQR